MSDNKDLSTLAIHAGDHLDAFGAAVTPLYDTTTFSFANTENLLDIVEGRNHGPLYTRYGMNPSITTLEKRLAEFDTAEAALTYASGMAAISSLCLAYGRGGIICVGQIYGGTSTFLQDLAPTLGIKTQFIDANDNHQLEKALKNGASLVFLETPSNPTLQIIDIASVASVTHNYSAKLAVDNTFATPINQQPLTLGADFSVQSATKYLGGHSDLTAGVVTGKAKALSILNEWRKSLGQTIAAETAHKLKRSLVTLPLRVEKHNQNALKIAEFLQRHKKVEKVYYPGLKTNSDHELASQQMHGFGGMLSFDVKGGDAAARRVIDSFKLIKLAPSLGGAETLATQPITTSHHGLPEALLNRAGISGAMIRLSVGLESETDIAEDLDQALLANI
ncbi:MAG TPA: aminotransferase class I/II-fold pyridoxal phosphate-dependent enzyme [Methylophaga sp.]|nr:aminotransferase class I/II-fold pyridoxal phosphate-dependent enzyme [Methylophaga sp.]